MTTVTLQVNDIDDEKIVNSYSKDELKTMFLRFLKTAPIKPVTRERPSSKKTWDEIESELKNLKPINKVNGEKIRDALTTLGKGAKIGDSKKAREEYLSKKFAI